VGRRSIRASDADREQVAERLRQATAEGRLLAEELEQRLGAVFAARTYGELDALTADLPSGRNAPVRTRTRPLARVRQLPAPALVLLVPMAMAIAIAAVVVVVTITAFWALMITIAWLAFGHRRPYYPARYYRRTMRHAYSRWRA
jgi:ABC-type nitrate/sulfonate/bicarbonate transport system permease component